MLKILKEINRPLTAPKNYKRFTVDGVHLGLVRPQVAKVLLKYPDVFEISPDQVSLSKTLDNYDKRSFAVENVLKRLKAERKFAVLAGWRNEYYDVKAAFDSPPLLRMDRSSTCLFGIKNYGINLNGYVKHPTLGLCLWLQKRSLKKERWPGYWDTMVGGGISSGQTVKETVLKESAEEASISSDFHREIVSVGTVGCFYESDEGIFPNTAFVFDLELPLDFIPRNIDGEVDSFDLVPAEECLRIIERGNFKKTVVNVAVDFCIRHSIITPDNHPCYVGIVEMLHVQLQTLYQNE
ncbi:hypothetical protein Trydic_g21780 [Trypoxylus dichotomus]